MVGFVFVHILTFGILLFHYSEERKISSLEKISSHVVVGHEILVFTTEKSQHRYYPANPHKVCFLVSLINIWFFFYFNRSPCYFSKTLVLNVVSELLYIGKYWTHFIFAPIGIVVSGWIQDLSKFWCPKFSLFKHNYFWANSRWDEPFASEERQK